MPVIAAKNFATGTQNYLNLGVDSYSRTLSIGTQWNRIRIGILCSVSTVQETSYPIRTAQFSIGVCNGINNNAGVFSAKNCHGYSHRYPPYITSVGSTWTYNAGTAGNSYFSTADFVGFKIENGAQLSSTAGSFTAYFPSSTALGGATARRGIYVADLSKSALVSGNLLKYGASGAVAHMSLDLTTEDLFSAIQQYTSAPVIRGTAMAQATGAVSQTFNETTYGMLDTVFVYWGMYAVPFQVYEIAVWRVG
jgi:hypothetical protein